MVLAVNYLRLFRGDVLNENCVRVVCGRFFSRAVTQKGPHGFIFGIEKASFIDDHTHTTLSLLYSQTFDLAPPAV